MQVVLLGTGTPNPDPERSGPAVAVLCGDAAYLVDCGPGIVRRAEAARQRGVRGLAPPKLQRLFLSHLHSDHTAGLPDLLLTPWVMGRRTPLEVFGPPGTREMVSHIQAAYREDVRERRDGLEPANDEGWRTEVKEIGPGPVYRDQHVSVEAFPVQHGSWIAFGYRFVAPDRSVVISGDTGPCEALAEAARGCDLLVHEVYSSRGLQTHDAAWRAYHQRVHTSTRELAALAGTAQPRLLVLYHQLHWGVSDVDLVAEITASYDGPVISGCDLGIY